MQPLNYCRQMVAQAKGIVQMPSALGAFKASLAHLIDIAALSEKFMLPEGADLFLDDDLRALDPDLGINLPFRAIAIEFFGSVIAGKPPTKQIVFAVQDDDQLRVYQVWHLQQSGCWVSPEGDDVRCTVLTKDMAKSLLELNREHPGQLCRDHNMLVPLLRLLNALACKNVSTQRIKQGGANKKIKAALPFDDYHVLMVDTTWREGARVSGSSHRSPREHLRRGHKRRLPSGDYIFVQACVVAAGRGAGKITKDYAIKPHHDRQASVAEGIRS